MIGRIIVWLRQPKYGIILDEILDAIIIIDVIRRLRLCQLLDLHNFKER